MHASQGMLHAASYSDPDPAGGYTTCDQARALFMLVLYNEQFPDDPFIDKYFDTYLTYMEKAIQRNGCFLNYMDQHGVFTARNQMENLDEINAGAFLALCRFISGKATGEGQRYRAQRLIAQNSKFTYAVRSPLAQAKLLKALYYQQIQQKEPVQSVYIHKFAGELIRRFEDHSEQGWKWFDPFITTGCSTIPEGLMYAYLATNEISYKNVAVTTMQFLIDKVIREGQVRAVCRNGWIGRETRQATAQGERPEEVAELTEALCIFHQATADSTWLEHLHTSFSWFLGNNHLRQPVYSTLNGGCHDSLEQHKINGHQGAEATLAWLASRLILEKVKAEQALLTEILTLREAAISKS
jgi:hypothetical protein